MGIDMHEQKKVKEKNKKIVFKLAKINQVLNNPISEIWLEFANFLITTVLLMFCFPYMWQQISYGVLSILLAGYNAYNSYRSANSCDVLYCDEILWKHSKTITVILLITAFLPAVIGYYIDGYSKDLMVFKDLIFENLLPNICGASISISLLFHIRRLNRDYDIVRNIVKEKHTLISRIAVPIILNFTFIITAKYFDIRQSYAYMINTLFLFIVTFIGILSAFYMSLIYLGSNKLSTKIELIYPFWTLFFGNVYLASYGFPSVFMDNMKFEFTLFISIAIAFLVSAIVLYHLAVSTIQDKRKPIVQMLGIMFIFFVIVITTAFGVEKENIFSFDLIIISFSIWIFVAILLILLGLQQRAYK